jgi:multidrug efflux system membrane fusion protein
MSRLSLCLFAGCCLLLPNLQGDDEKEVAVSQPIEQTVVDYEDFTGRTEAVQSVDVRARVTGYLTKIAFRDGEQVKKGDLLYEIDPRPYKAALDQAQAELVVGEASLKLALAQYERLTVLKAKTPDAVSREDLDKAKAEVDIGKARLRARQAALEGHKINLDYTQLRAPMDGQISRTYFAVGNLILADQTLLATIVSQDPMHVYCDMDERSVFRWRRTFADSDVDKAKIPVSMGLAGETGFPHEGIMDYIDNRVDARTGTLRVRGVFANPKKELLPGMFVRCRLPMSKPYRALLVSQDAVFDSTRDGEHTVWIVNEKGKVEKRHVKLGQSVEKLRVVREGLKAGERVIVSRASDVRDGDTVKTRRVSMPGAPRRTADKEEKPK